jgi:hypothetical protein
MATNRLVGPCLGLAKLPARRLIEVGFRI